ncbi:flavodoxin domain-containing protein [Natroniella sulfidigena]|uniref:flavodoxin family protein n=1 Tax=Natroniella sulfidigena TaxID=723921 RepID=UPI00200B1EF7|nr:flavodoxin domain-containing protein [Natroniella sulfidigena]MCK8817677.1 flavodoxin domain-containing protein [Natroniella sulfidigena]
MKEVVVIYWSKTGNTEQVARSIQKGAKKARANVSLLKIEEAKEIDFYDYDLVCLGVPSYHWHPPKPADRFLKNKFKEYRKEGKVKLGAPKVEGKNALVFCTYSGPHTGIDEAIPVGDYVGQFFAHFGFNVVDKLYILSEFKANGTEGVNLEGRMGDIRGLPTAEQLEKISQDTEELVSNL